MLPTGTINGLPVGTTTGLLSTRSGQAAKGGCCSPKACACPSSTISRAPLATGLRRSTFDADHAGIRQANVTTVANMPPNALHFMSSGGPKVLSVSPLMAALSTSAVPHGCCVLPYVSASVGFSGPAGNNRAAGSQPQAVPVGRSLPRAPSLHLNTVSLYPSGQRKSSRGSHSQPKATLPRACCSRVRRSRR